MIGSRTILQELVIVANTAIGTAWIGGVIVDSSLNAIGAANSILFSTQGQLVALGEFAAYGDTDFDAEHVI